MISADLNIHLCAGDSLSNLLHDDFSLECPTLLERIRMFMVSVGSELNSFNFMLFNQGLSVGDIKSISSLCSTYAEKNIFLTLLASPDRIASFEDLSILKSSGISAITFHSYHQYITKTKYSVFAKLAAWAEELKMPILVDGSYGTLDIYNIDNLDLVSFLASRVKNTPIIIMHSGGARVLDAMLLAESVSNIYLETSFSLQYYIGSSIENDLAFAYKKLGPEKVIYASDYPYISSDKALSVALDFFSRHDFSSNELEWIFSKSFDRVFSANV